MSMAVCVLQACACRAVAKNAKLMIHDGYSELGKIVSSRVQVQAKEALELNEKYYRALEERSNLSLEQVQSLCEDETYMSAEVAVGYGFADTIIGSEPARRSRRSK